MHRIAERLREIDALPDTHHLHQLGGERMLGKRRELDGGVGAERVDDAVEARALLLGIVAVEHREEVLTVMTTISP